jgi:hypothetical protein
MSLWRTKPVVVEAVRVPMPDQFEEHGLVWGLFYRRGFRDFMVTEDKGYDIRTLEGTMHASPGDWIIRGVKGEFYPCKPDIFEATYEPALEEMCG